MLIVAMRTCVFLLVLFLRLCYLVELILDNGKSRLLVGLVQQLELLFRLSQLLHHATLLKYRMRLHQVLPSVLRADHFLIGGVLHDDHQCANNLLRLGELGTRLPIQELLELFDFLELFECVIELISSQVDKGNVTLDLARPDILETVGLLVDVHGLVQVHQ